MSTALHDLDQISARDVADLVANAAWPSVTVLMDTEPAPRMTHADRLRLESLVTEADRQLAARAPLGQVRLTQELRALAVRASRRPTGAGVVLLVNRGLQRAYRLPEPVEPRTVVEHTFRTRELLHVLHRTPPHLLLQLHPTCAQLYRVYADTMVPLDVEGFPVQLVAPQRGRLREQEDVTEDFLEVVDRRLERARRHHPSPLIVAGHPDPVGRLVRRSRHLDRLAGVVTAWENADPSVLYLEAKACLEEYLASRQDEALLLVEEAERNRREHVHHGIEAAWTAAHTHRPEMLVVEESHHFPAVVDDRGVRRLDFLADPALAPDGAHTDLVDDLVERVIDRGGWVAFAAPGRLGSRRHLALVTRPR